MNSLSRPTVNPVLSGHLVRDGNVIVDASSSVTLVEAVGKRLVVDTGSPGDQIRLVNALEEMGVKPDSVDYVINTHLHLDHCGCNDLFTRARYVAHALESPPVGSFKLKDRTQLLPGVELVPTPGHTAGSLSVFVEAAVRVVIAGDAMPTKDNYERKVPPFINIDSRLASRSMDVIASWADTVIPGHGTPFKVLRKE